MTPPHASVELILSVSHKVNGQVTFSALQFYYVSMLIHKVAAPASSIADYEGNEVHRKQFLL